MRRLVALLRANSSPAAFWALVATFVAVLAGLTFAIVNNRNLARDGKQAHDALCILKGDLEQRVKSTQDFLNTHPQGFAGIDAATIQNSLNNQRATVDSLSLLDCVPPPKENP